MKPTFPYYLRLNSFTYRQGHLTDSLNARFAWSEMDICIHDGKQQKGISYEYVPSSDGAAVIRQVNYLDFDRHAFRID